MELIAQRRLPDTVHAIAAAPRDPRLAAVAYGPYLAELDVELVDVGSLRPVLCLPKHGVVRALAWSPDQRVLATGGGAYWFGDKGSRTESVYLWDPLDGHELARFARLFGVRSLAFSADSRLLITAGMNGPPSDQRPSVDLWEAASGRHLSRLLDIPWIPRQRNPKLTSVFFAGDELAVAIVDSTARCWNVSTGLSVECPSLKPTGLSPDSRWIARATGCQVDNHGPYENTAIELLDAHSGRLVARGAHAKTPHALSFTADSRCVIAGGAEGELRCWRLP